MSTDEGTIRGKPSRLHALQGRANVACPECSHPLSRHTGDQCRDCREDAGVEFWPFCSHDEAHSAWRNADLRQRAKSRRLCCAPPVEVDP